MPDSTGSTILVQGKPGLTAFQLAQQNGFTGTEQAWLDSLKGETGLAAGFVNRGDWVTGTTYSPNEYVFATSSGGGGTSIWMVKKTFPFVSVTQPKDEAAGFWFEHVPGNPYVPMSRLISTQYSLTGGGNLSADRTLNLVGDVASPGLNKVYGTDGAGVRGWYTGGGGGSGDVISDVGVSVDSELVKFAGVTGKHVTRATGTGLAKLTSGVLSTITDNSTNWDSAYTDRLKWDGGSTGLVVQTGRDSLGLKKFYNLKVDFGANGDGKVIRNAAITSGTAALSSVSNPFVSGDVGKTIMVTGAKSGGNDLVTTILSFTDAGHVTLNANATATVSSAVAIWGSDNTSALQSAIDTTATGTSAYIYIPAGIYMFSAALITTGGYNAQIKIPNVDCQTGIPGPQITLAGEATPQNPSFAIGDYTGTILFSTGSGSGTRPCFIGTPHLEGGTYPFWFTAVMLKMQDLKISCPCDPNISMLDFTCLSNLIMENITIGAASTPTGGPTTTTSCALITPTVGTPSPVQLRNVSVGNMYNGFLWGELVVANDLSAGLCVFGIQFTAIKDSAHASHIGRFLSYGCPNVLYATTKTNYITIEQLDEERLTGPAWAVHAYDLYDTGGKLSGHARFHAFDDTIADVNENFIVSTGTKFTSEVLRTGATSTQSGGSSVVTGVNPGTNPAYPGNFWIAANQNADTQFRIFNTYGGNATRSLFDAENGTHVALFGITGTSWAQAGEMYADTAFVTTNTTRLLLSANNASGKVEFGGAGHGYLGQISSAGLDSQYGYKQAGAALNFSHLAGNIAVSQMASGVGANSLSFFRGDNSWAVPLPGATGTGPYYKAVTIDHTKCGANDSTNFPMLFNTTHGDFKTVANGGHVQNASGFDIRPYADAALTTPLTFQLIRYNATTGEVVMRIKIPTLSHTVDTVIYMRYGDSSLNKDGSSNAVWDSNYKAVFPLSDGTTLSLNDVTSNLNNLSGVGTPTAVEGQVDGAANFNGTSQYATSNTAPATAPPITFEGWIKPSSSGIISGILDSAGVWNGFYCSWDSATGNFSVSTVQNNFAVAGTSSKAGPGAGVWQYVAGVITSTNSRTAYVNGVAGTTDTTSVTPTATPNDLSMADAFHQGINDNLYGGQIDEWRISNVARTPDYFVQVYNNENSPNTFYSLGVENGNVTIAGYLDVKGGYLINVQDGAVFEQTSTLQITGPSSMTVAGSGTVLVYDVSNSDSYLGKGQFATGSFTLRSGEYLMQYDHMNLNGNASANLTEDAVIVVMNPPSSGSLVLTGT